MTYVLSFLMLMILVRFKLQNTPIIFALGSPGLHTTARELLTCTFQGPGASNTTKIPRKDLPRRGKKERKLLWWEWEKKCEILGSPPFGAAPFGAPPEEADPPRRPLPETPSPGDPPPPETTSPRDPPETPKKDWCGGRGREGEN